MQKFGTSLETCYFPGNRYIFTWTLRNFSSLQLKTLRSPELSLFTDFRCSCEINSIYLSGFKVVIYSSAFLDCEITLVNASSDILLLKKVSASLSVLRKTDPLHYETILEFDHRDKTHEKLRCLVNDTLVLVFCLSIPSKMETLPISRNAADPPTTASYLKTLATKVELLPKHFSEQKVILCVEKRRVTVNKAVLCASSPVFAKMFENKMREELQNSITIQDIEMSLVVKLIDFLYTGILPDGDEEFLCNLYYVADKYDITQLRDGCRNSLLTKITVDNVTQILKLSNVHNDNLLKSYAVGFLGVHLNPVLLTKGWWEMMHDETRIALEAITSFYVDSNSSN